MNKIAFLTDLGSSSFELMHLKLSVFLGNAEVQILDLFNDINNFDVMEAYFFLSTVWNKIDENTLIVVSVGESSAKDCKWIVAQCEQKTIIAPNNGILPMVLDHLNPVYLGFDNNLQLPEVLSLVLNNDKWENSCPAISYPVKFIPQKAHFDGKYIRGTIVHIDKFGNLYCNISQDLIAAHISLNEIVIRVRRDEQLDKISTNFNDVGQGDILALFDNEKAHLIIAINTGNAQKLLGLGIGKNIFVGKK